MEIKLDLLEIPNENIYGFRYENMWYIGSIPAVIEDNILHLNNEKYTLTKGLMNLLSQKKPSLYTKKDLDTYREILLHTNAHRWSFQRSKRVNANKSWKYVNLIAKLFQPKRIKVRRIQQNAASRGESTQQTEAIPCQSELEDEDLDDVDPNELVAKFMYYENTDSVLYKNKIIHILRKLEQLGIIKFK